LTTNNFVLEDEKSVDF